MSINISELSSNANFFIRTEEAVKNYIREAGNISFIDISLSIRSEDRQGIMLNRESLIELYSLFGFNLNEINNHASSTEYDSIYMVNAGGSPILATAPITDEISCVKFPPTNVVLSRSWRAIIREVADKILSPKLNKPIHIYHPHGESFDPAPMMDNNNPFTISLFSSSGSEYSEVSSAIKWFGRAHGDAARVMMNPAENPLFCIDDSGYVFASCYSNGIYIHPDLFHYNPTSDGGMNSIKTFSDILSLYINRVNMPIEELNALKRTEMVKAFIASRQKVYKENIKAYESDLNIANATVEKYQMEYRKALYKMEHCMKMLEAARTSKTPEEEAAIREINNIMSCPKIIDVSVSDATLCIYTDFLYCKHPKTNHIHLIGKFNIKINMSPTSDLTYIIMFHNLTHKRNGYESGMNSPHAFPSGKPCLGTLIESLPELQKQGDFYTLVIVAIQFIESVNIEDSAGRYITVWPIVDPVTRKVIHNGYSRDTTPPTLTEYEATA